jgi:hypothetical protein
MKKILIGSLVATSLLFAVDNAQININSDTLEISGEYGLNDSFILDDNSNYSLTLSYLNSEKATVTKAKSKLVSIGLKIMDPYTNDMGFSLGLGMKGAWVDNHSESFFATPLELFARYDINDVISLDLSASYAPKILTHSNGDKYQDTNFKLNYQIIDNGCVYLGIRDIETNYKSGANIKFDDSAFFGYKVQF